MKTTSYRAIPWTTRLLLTLLVLPILSFGAADAAQQPVQMTQIANVTEIHREATPTPLDEVPDLPANPFPATTWMTDTVHAVAAALAQGDNGQSEQLPAVTLIDAIGSQTVLAATHRLYLPNVRRAQGAVTPSPTPKPTPRPDDDDDDDDESGADIGVGIWPNPSVRVARNGTVAYEVRVTNFGRGRAGSVHVKLPQNPALMQVYGSTIPGATDWVSEKTSTSVTLTFGPFGKGEQRTATVFFRLKAGLADGTLIPMRASYTWSDSDKGGESKTNAAPVLVGAQDERSAWALFDMMPKTGRTGSSHQVATDRFAPGEGVSYWLNTPDGSVKAMEHTSVADGNGSTHMTFRSTGLPAGKYSLVGQGRRSGVVVVGFFTVTS